jgi:hypothetical protein
MVKAQHSTQKIGLNAQTKSFITSTSGDWNLYEPFNQYQGTGDQDSTKLAMGDSAAPTMFYDDYLTGTFEGVMLYWDYSTLWDRGNRGPLVMLTKHLIGQTLNTTFAYTSGPWSAYYSERDDVTLADGTTIIHLGSIPKDQWPTSAQVKRWGSYFPAMSVDFGTATGVRNIDWAVGLKSNCGANTTSHGCKPGDTDYGWGGNSWGTNGTNGGHVNNIWSRDFTNCLVLHRPNGTTGDFATYSVSIPLDGAYYPLSADGTTAAAITSIQLRRGEGAILMKAPIGGGATTSHRATMKVNSSFQCKGCQF